MILVIIVASIVGGIIFFIGTMFVFSFFEEDIRSWWMKKTGYGEEVNNLGRVWRKK